ncbi:hypothetical protein A2572_01490 [Candidatus Collierbacteria bacterium RIFOXYD1_FULL_40_9]|uniref:Uncharacterized protein n=1 Tax=Candidatus Collierbacteria bacterium RIFOXYD1_FULL_40_9 TaxID=1817731 RepID=A0A1F5FVR1_9BACT|nr:MAG: hypothetical protein A2572_01490 [Candidatus Collierbacteria bacterium RIFOXYD1_FULL_40_9]
MSIKKILFKNTFFNLLGYIYLLAASFLSISIYLNNLGQDMFGIYIFLASFVPIASVFDFGVSIALIRDLAKNDTSLVEKKESWQTGLYIFLIQAVILGIFFAGLILYFFYHLPLLTTIANTTNIYTLAVILGLTIFLNHVNNALLSIPQAFQRFDVYNSKTYLVGTANTLLSAWLTYYTKDLVHVFLLQLIFHAVTFFYALNFGKKQIGKEILAPVYYKNAGRKLIAFGLKNFVGTLAGQVEAQISKFFLGFLATAKSITAFNIPQSIFMKGAGVVSQVAQAFFPLSATLLEKNRIKKLKKLYISLQFLILFSGVFVVFLVFNFGEDFLTWWLKDLVVVSASLPVLKIMSYYFVLVALTPLPTALAQGLGKPQVPSFFAVLTVTVETVFLSILVPKYHEIGAAYSFLISSIVSVPVFILYLSFLLNKKINEYK